MKDIIETEDTITCGNVTLRLIDDYLTVVRDEPDTGAEYEYIGTADEPDEEYGVVNWHDFMRAARAMDTKIGLILAERYLQS